MQDTKNMRQNMGGQTSVAGSIDQPQDQQDNALSVALKQRRIAKAAKRRLVAPNNPDDNPGAIENPNPEDDNG
jgi:hypothetical protein